MRAPKDVVLDLLPAYFAGEVSPLTRAWIEQYLAEDPELAAHVRREQRDTFEGTPPPLPPGLELRTLQRTRRILALLRWLFGFAMTFSAVGLALEVSLRPLRIRPLLFDYPTLLLPCVGAGIVCWMLYFRLRSQLRMG